MILVVDSGSTKTDWRFIDQGAQQYQLKTEGINPYYMTASEIHEVMKKGFEDYKELEITEVYFYGSGCSSDKNKQIIRDVVADTYAEATVSVEHDLTAAARALCGNDRGVACILGTGSNSALYDGKNIIENTPSLGYMLGDKGSGNHLGRLLIQSYFKNRLSQVVKNQFDEQFGLTIVQVLEHIYQKGMPVRFFAGFSEFMKANIGDESIHDLVDRSFSSFITENIMQYTNFRSEEIHFTGSVAYHYENILASSCRAHDLKLGSIVKEPIEGLLKYHGENL